MTGVEILSFPGEAPRTTALFDALAREAPGAAHRTRSYAGTAPLLVLWGPGAPERREIMRQQVASGGHALVWDAAYWSRDTKWRVSIDAPHPQAWVPRAQVTGDRLAADPPHVRDLWRQDGPVVVAGIGAKATVQYGASVVADWEASMIARARAAGYEVKYRPKRRGALPRGVQPAIAGDIDHAIGYASAVVTWHSNVAVDAIRLGIPAICRDGAAAAVCPSTWGDAPPQPLTRAERVAFLERLAYFQWRTTEAPLAWRFLQELLA